MKAKFPCSSTEYVNEKHLTQCKVCSILEDQSAHVTQPQHSYVTLANALTGHHVLNNNVWESDI